MECGGMTVIDVVQRALIGGNRLVEALHLHKAVAHHMIDVPLVTGLEAVDGALRDIEELRERP